LDQTFCLAGPDRLTLEEILRIILDALRLRRLLVPLSPRILRPFARMNEALLPAPPLTLDQLRMLQEEHPCDPAAAEAVFGRRFLPFREGVAMCLRSPHDA
jgi:DNA repair protein RadC